mgnify:CR=1 FL=1
MVERMKRNYEKNSPRVGFIYSLSSDMQVGFEDMLSRTSTKPPAKNSEKEPMYSPMVDMINQIIIISRQNNIDLSNASYEEILSQLNTTGDVDMEDFCVRNLVDIILYHTVAQGYRPLMDRLKRYGIDPKTFFSKEELIDPVHTLSP